MNTITSPERKGKQHDASCTCTLCLLTILEGEADRLGDAVREGRGSSEPDAFDPISKSIGRIARIGALFNRPTKTSMRVIPGRDDDDDDEAMETLDAAPPGEVN
jgi:hypothetical protein